MSLPDPFSVAAAVAIVRAIRPTASLIRMLLATRTQWGAGFLAKWKAQQDSDAIEERKLRATLAGKWDEAREIERERENNNRSAVLAAAIDEAQTFPPLPEGEEPKDSIHPDMWDGFWQAAQRVSEPEMQRVWGRILAEECGRPGHFSLRTLDLVRVLSRDDIKTFEELATRAFLDARPYIPAIPTEPGEDLPLEELRSHGLLLPTTMNLTAKEELGGNNIGTWDGKLHHLIRNGHRLLIRNGSPEAMFNAYVFTKAGEELLPIARVLPNNEFYARFKAEVEAHGWTLREGDIENTTPAPAGSPGAAPPPPHQRPSQAPH